MCSVRNETIVGRSTDSEATKQICVCCFGRKKALFSSKKKKKTIKLKNEQKTKIEKLIGMGK